MTTAVVVAATVHPVELELHRPLITARGEVRTRPIVVLRLVDDGGRVGWGEASRWPGVPTSDLTRRVRSMAGSAPGRTPAELLTAEPPDVACQAALHTAALDLSCQAHGVTLGSQLTAQPLRTQVMVNALVGGGGVADTVAAASEAVARGFQVIKVKVGAAAPPVDIARVTAVRERVGSAVGLRLDANRGWTRRQAEQVLGELAPLGLEHVEDPVTDTADLHGLAESVGVAVAVDEPLVAADPAVRLRQLAAHASVAVIKPAAVGGPIAAVALAELAAELGLAVVVTSNIDGAVGRAMALHVASAVPGRLGACGLATAELLVFDITSGVPVDHPTLAIRTDQPGLGVDVDVATQL